MMRWLITAWLLFGLVSGAASPLWQNPRPDVASPQDGVRLVTLVVSLPVVVQDRHGRFIVDLRREEFHVFDDGVEQPVTHFAPLEEPFSAVLLLDTSGSTRFILKEIQESALAFIAALEPADRVYPIAFDNQVRPLVSVWTNDRERLTEAVRGTHTGMDPELDVEKTKAKPPKSFQVTTRLYDAVKMGFELLKPVTGRKALIILSDGFDTASQRATSASTLKEAEELGAFIYTVKYPDRREHADLDPEPARDKGVLPFNWIENWVYLEDLAKRSGGRFYRVINMKRVLAAFAAIAEELRHQYSLGYYPQPLPGPGEARRIQVKVDRHNVSVRTRKRYVFDSAPKSP